MRALRWALLAIVVLIMITAIGNGIGTQPVLATAKFADGTVLEYVGYTYGPVHQQVSGTSFQRWSAAALPLELAHSFGARIQQVQPQPASTPVLWLRVHGNNPLALSYLDDAFVSDGSNGRVKLKRLRNRRFAAYAVSAHPSGDSQFTLEWRTSPPIRMEVPVPARQAARDWTRRTLSESRLADGTTVRATNLTTASPSLKSGPFTQLSIQFEPARGRTLSCYPEDDASVHDEQGNRYGPFEADLQSTRRGDSWQLRATDSLFAGPDTFEVHVPLRRTRSEPALKGVEWITPVIDVPPPPEIPAQDRTIVAIHEKDGGEVQLLTPYTSTEGHIDVTVQFAGLKTRPGVVLKRCTDMEGKRFEDIHPIFSRVDGIPAASFTIYGAGRAKQVRMTFEFYPAEVAILRLPVKRIGYK